MENVVTFNGIALPQWVKVTGINFPVLPTIDVRESIIPRRYGNVDNGVKFGGKTIKLAVMILLGEKDNLQDRADELKAWLRGDNWKPSKLIFDEQPDRYMLARVSNEVDIEDLFFVGTGEIEFYSANPLKYSLQETTETGNSNGVSLPYVGLEKAPTVISVEITQACTDLSISHKETGNQIYLRGNFNSGQTVVVDSNRKLVQVDGITANTLLDFTSRWIYVEHGANTITSSSLTEGVVNRITVSYRRTD